MITNTIRAALTALALLIIGPAVASAATPSLYYPFDEGQGTSAIPSVGSGQALIQGGAGWISGKSGNAVGLDGKTGETIALGTDILPKATVGSISMWVKTNSLSDNNYFLSIRNPNDDKTYWTLAADHEGRLIIRYRTGSSALDQKNESSAILDNNTWYNVVVTADSLKYTFYVNGEMVGSSIANIGKWPSDILQGNLRYALGSLDAADHTGILDGFLDELVVYPTVLTLDEVKAQYFATNEKKPSVPAAATPQIALTISDTTIPNGGSANVTWNVTNATSCSSTWTNNGPVELSGSMLFSKLGSDQSYGITCLKTGGVANSATVAVHVLPVGATTTPTMVPQVPVTEITLANHGPVITRSLAFGARGNDVKTLQAFLIRKGLLQGTATGYFGKLTEAAVRAFQKANGLDSVGFVGPKTRARLQVSE